MTYEYFYPGTKYSMESPIYGNSNAYSPRTIPLSDLGLTTDGRTANQLQEVSNKLNTGAKVMEISGSDAALLDSVPKGQFKEINRLTKLTGTEVTLHGPQIEASGYSKEGWSEVDRMGAERQMKNAIERAHELSPDGNIPITFHSTAILPEMEEKVMTKEGEKTKSLWVVDPRTGKYGQIKEEERYFPGQEGEFDPKKELARMNKDAWTQEVGNINISASRGEQIMNHFVSNNKSGKKILEGYSKFRENPKEFEKLPEEFKSGSKEIFRELDTASIFLKDAYRGLRTAYNMAYKESSPEDRKKLDQFANEIKPFVEKEIESDPSKIEDFADLIAKGVNVLDNIKNPNIYKPFGEFVIEKSAKTFAGTAFHGYKEYGDKAPIVSIENPPAGGGLSRAEDLKKLIEESRKEFVKIAKTEGYSASEAENAANKLIGATWDVGHINMLRKFGYKDKDLIKQAETIAPMVKHVHLSDNFGFEHTELPMGMGNVPTKEIMEKFGKEGFEGKKIIEAFQWWQHMKTPPLVPTLEAFGSPLYPMLAQPNWTASASVYGSYFQFPSAYFPDQHFSLYGSGFANLPPELGGQIPGKQGNRLTGTPME